MISTIKNGNSLDRRPLISLISLVLLRLNLWFSLKMLLASKCVMDPMFQWMMLHLMLLNGKNLYQISNRWWKCLLLSKRKSINNGIVLCEEWLCMLLITIFQIVYGLRRWKMGHLVLNQSCKWLDKLQILRVLLGIRFVIVPSWDGNLL